MSTLAEVIVEKAFELGIDSARSQFGAPRLEDGSECEWAVLALGKFGGSDMGFGSDLELIFVYEAEGTTDGPKPTRTSTFFNEVVREFLQVLETRQHGVFEVDMRLRPYGSKGALASSLAAVEDYYASRGGCAAVRAARPGQDASGGRTSRPRQTSHAYQGLVCVLPRAAGRREHPAPASSTGRRAGRARLRSTLRSAPAG